MNSHLSERAFAGEPPDQAVPRPSIGPVSPLVALVAGLLLGGAVAATVILRSRPHPAIDGQPSVAALPEAALARRLVDLMDPAVVIVDVDDAVLLANPSARALGIVRGSRLLVPDLLTLAGTV